MRRRVRHHVNPLGGRLLHTHAARIVRGARPLEVELGCADARFLFERAPHHPEVDFIGVEIREPLVDEVNELARSRGIPNLRAVFANITSELDHLFEDGALRRIFVNFPDPWFKARHHKRRLMTHELAGVLVRKLEPGGELLFQSDIWDLGIEALFVLECEAGLTNVAGEFGFLRENPYDAKSLREVRVEEYGIRVWRMLFRRQTL